MGQLSRAAAPNIGPARALQPAEIRSHASSYVDPQGFVFEFEQQFYRCIRPDAAPLFRRLLADGLLARLSAEYGIVETREAGLVLADEPDSLVLHHARVEPATYCVEWCHSMLWEAARLTLDLTRDLTAHDLMLQDAYPWNVLFRGCEPVFVDVSSIKVADAGVLWPAADQFEAFFQRPLILSAEGKGRAARALLLDNISGVGLDDFSKLVSLGHRLKHPGLALTRLIDRRLQGSPYLKKRVRKMAAHATASATPEIRRRFIDQMRRRLETTRREIRDDVWTDYYAEIPDGVNKAAKLAQVRQLLDRLGSKNVLDLGCNTGVFSLAAAEAGARVVAVDSSESAIEALFACARAEALPVTPIVADVLCPTPAFGFLGRQHPSLWKRVRCETALCLGLMHHLVVSGRQNLERIADLIDAVAGRSAIFEYIGLDDDNMPHLSARRPIEYTLEAVIEALGRKFPQVEPFPSDRPARKILLCTR